MDIGVLWNLHAVPYPAPPIAGVARDARLVRTKYCECLGHLVPDYGVSYCLGFCRYIVELDDVLFEVRIGPSERIFGEEEDKLLRRSPKLTHPYSPKVTQVF
jgi:hypothetical protein